MLLKMKGVNFKYKDKHVLKDISMTLNEGEVALVLGPNGAGKSTLLRLIAGGVRGVGRLWLCGKLVMDETTFVPPEKRCVAFVPQGASVPPHKTVEENLKFAKSSDVDELLEIFGLKKFLKVKAGKLSGGQKKRLSILMALTSPKRVLLLDEPMSAIDPRSRSEIAGVIIEEIKRRRKAALWVTHLKEIIGLDVDARYLLKEGRLRLLGDEDEL